MVSSITGLPPGGILAGIAPQQTTPSGSATSFTDQLAAALEGYLAQTGSSANLEIDIQTTQSQVSGARQFIVTVKNPDSAAAPSNSPASGSAPASGTNPAAVAPASVQTPDTPAPPAAPLNELDAYWAAQPEPVQQLRNMDLGERAAMAQELADQGYIIDKPIMVWGWDPKMTMQARKEYGYTWVPSWNQPNCSTPGLAVGKQTPYDPNKPPDGSIAVNTDFLNAKDSSTAS